ncbi:MAG: methylmalonyl-CoA epimerase [SAR116 cluster bacterium]|nr:methylmalonyl-CoA epimerase [SAR116 cluster bacterium]RPG90438.1 MAG: methylmalonyl-CoA epimerase [Candidatus Puniceispirillum sp. TMED213]|tara:strand:- start:178 stop:582 length:405 start_codon:yes stop_codon:yes gene_type:complete
MIGSINHIAIAVPDLGVASAQWRERFGAVVSAPKRLPKHGVKIVFIAASNGKIELLEPLDDNSPIGKFLERNPDGGLHHICFDVPDLIASRDQLLATGARILGNPDPEIGAHGKPVLFIHPKDLTGSLIELQQA